MCPKTPESTLRAGQGSRASTAHGKGMAPSNPEHDPMRKQDPSCHPGCMYISIIDIYPLTNSSFSKFCLVGRLSLLIKRSPYFYGYVRFCCQDIPRYLPNFSSVACVSLSCVFGALVFVS